MKDSRFFPHDMGARNDPKLIRLQMEMKGQGLAIWWCIVEMLWENGGYLPHDPKTIAFTLRWAKASEVERVLNDFDLFSTDGERFWSKSALERIDTYNSRIEAARTAGRASGERRRKDSTEQPLNDRSTDVEQPLNNGSTINKQINKQINKYISNKPTLNNPFNADTIDRHKILEIFFFELNAPQPAAEVQRFIDHYSARGWKLGDGNPVVDPLAVARLWKPEKPVKRFPQTFLRWYWKLYDECGRIPGMLSDLLDGELKGTTAMLRYTTKKVAESARDILGTKPSAQGIDITWKFNNQGNA